MHKSCRPRLCFATLLIAYSLLRITSSQALPSSLQSGIPICAQTCLTEAIDGDFVPSVCSSAQDFDCLCSHYGTDGYTLGERAFGCLYDGNCTSASQSNASAVYTICSGQNNAVTPTHSTVVVTALSTSSTSAPTSNPSMTAMAATSASSSASTATEASMISTSTSSSSSSGPIQLTEAQVAGIAIAAIALVVLTVGIAGCLLFIRRRNKNLEQEEAKLLFHHSRNGSGSQTSHLGTPWKDPRGMPGGVGIVPVERSPRPDMPPPLPPPIPLERTWPRYYPIMPGDTFMPRDLFVPQDGIGVAQTTNVPLQMPVSATAPAIPILPPEPAMVQPSMVPPSMAQPSMANPPRRSFSSAQERPVTNYGPPAPVAARPVESSTSPSKRARRSIDTTAVLSQVTEFEEDGTGTRSALQSPGFPPSQAQGQDESRGRPHSRPIVPALRTTSGSPRLRALRPSTLKIQIPTYPTTTVGAGQPTLVATTQPAHAQIHQFAFPPPPPRGPSQIQQPVTNATNVTRPPSLYNKRSSPPSNTESGLGALNPSRRPSPPQTAAAGAVVSTAANLASNRLPKHSSKLSKKSQRTASQPGRDSAASYTSFETVGSEDDPTPPKEENKELTPPNGGGSPISNLRYPKVPRSSNQQVSRTPPSPKNMESNEKLSPNKISSTPSPRNKAKATSPRGVADHLWRTETRPQDGPARINPYTYEAQYKFRPPESKQQQTVNTGAAQALAKSSPPQPTKDESGSWNWSPDLNATFAQFNPKSPFGPMPKLTPTKQGEDLYLSVSRE